MTFRDRITTRKGEIGERIVEQWLRDHGYEVFRPGDLGNSHTADFLTLPKKARCGVIVCDAKAKAARLKYQDTGFDIEHWHRYRSMGEAHGMRVFIFWVDEDLGKIYGNFLDVLEERHWHKNLATGNTVKVAYPKTENTVVSEIRYYELRYMIMLGDLTPQQIAELRSLTTRDPKYQAIAEQKAQQERLF